MTALGLALILALAAFSECGEAKQLHVYAFKKMNWFDAGVYCTRLGHELVSVMDAQEHSQLQQAIYTCSATCETHIEHSWTAGSDQAEEGHYIWTTNGQDIAADRWDPNHLPDNYEDNEDCVEAFDYPNEHHVILNDRPCQDELQYVVCQEKGH